MADAVIHDGEHGAHGHDHPPHLQHHFETSAQQFDASKLGMWLFLATEVLFFSGLFCAYTVYRVNHPEIFRAGHQFLDAKWGMINTIVLICSSFTMAMGVWCAQKSYRTGLIVCLALTLVGAFGFMGIKYIEYDHKIRNGVVWGPNYSPTAHALVHGDEAAHAHDDHGDAHAPAADAHAPASADAAAGDHAASETRIAGEAAAPGHAAATDGDLFEVSQIKPPPLGPSGVTAAALSDAPAAAAHGPDPLAVSNVRIFFGIYYGMTGLHGIHVLAGIIVIAGLLVNAIKGKYNSEYYTPVDLVGLYWHVVDLIWIFLFPMLYLIH